MSLLVVLLSMVFAGMVQAQEWVTMVVGTYTDGGSHGVYSFRFNQLTGESRLLDSLALRNPSYLTVSPETRLVYAGARVGSQVLAVSETNDAKASLNVIALEKSGRMKLLSQVPTWGEDPCYVATNGRFVLTANYSGGSMSAYSLSDHGKVARPLTRFLGATGGPDMSRQEVPHVHCAVFTPDGKYALATDFSADRILSYHLDGGRIVANGVASPVSLVSGPRHIVFSRDGRFAYLMSELSGKVTVFTYGDGRLSEIQSIASDTVGARGGADIHLSPDGRFLYSSNRLKAEGIAVFSVDPQTGLLTKIGYQPTKAHPRHFNITPNGRFLLCACRDDNTIQVFRRDDQTGLLSDISRDIPVSRAVCVQFQ